MGAIREDLERAPFAYFEAVDRKDLAGTLAFFDDDVTFTIQTAGTVYNGKDELAGMFRGFFADFSEIVHTIRNIVVDETAGKASTEQVVPLIAADGSPVNLVTCNFFTFGADGRFTRVIVWMDGASPLVGE